MKKIVVLLVAAAIAASPAAAASEHRKSKETSEAEQIAQQNDNTRRFLRDAAPLVLPVWALPIYFSMYPGEKNDEKKKTIKGRRHAG